MQAFKSLLDHLKRRPAPVLTTQTVTVLDLWLRERKGEPHDPLLPTSRGGR